MKPHQIIGQLFPKLKDKIEQNQVRGLVYFIPCADCIKEYIGKTKQQFSTRTGEHKKAVVSKQTKKSVLAEHSVKHGYKIDWELAFVLRQCENW